MKKLLLVAIVAATSFTEAWAQYPDPFLSGESSMKDYDFIQAPPSMTSGAFGNDFYYYQWGVEQRNIEGVSEQALKDEYTELRDVFSECLDFKLTEETTPEIVLLCECAVSDSHAANTVVKDIYQRKRPFATFNQPSLKPETDQVEALTYSYPSGHSSRGYMFALSLCTVAPEYTTKIMLRAQKYAINRVICGHHWKSDIDASLMLAAAVFANVVCSEAYQAQLKKAKEEYKSLTTGVQTTRSDVRQQDAAIYDLQGRRVDTPSQQGIYIQDGRKIVVR